ncbi:hypothetical protein Fot_13124 [Forsythia ovata]|uniref:Ycf49-like protein n=1 Tax=Forsythia ovata TaxID=205694 RepID=A0ABD1W330_9LAMI
MGILALISPPKPIFLHKSKQTHLSSPNSHAFAAKETIARHIKFSIFQNPRTITVLFGAAGIALTTIVGPAAATESPLFNEPANALSLPTWAIHVSSVVEWITAMALVWQYGEKSGYESWKGLSWGMVPLLGGAFCACTWHFFYNSEALEVLVALQAALTVIAPSWRLRPSGISECI